jgi:hypothetical protein
MEKLTTSSGAKAYQRKDTENRIKPYSDWHRTLDRNFIMLDVDFIEWRIKNGEPIPVGVMEITRVDIGKNVTEGYLAAIIDRYNNRDIQGKVFKLVAKALNTHAYIILFREDCSEFWVCRYSVDNKWYYLTPPQMSAFLGRLQ